ncbi:MAG: DUF4054 domain-containing protein [Pseudomonadota bacterium]
MTAVVFDPAAFKVRYPAFAAVSDVLLGLCFNEATLYLSNSDCSPVQNLTRRSMLLNMLVAHIAYLGGALSPGGGSLPVGRASSATEGSVSASLEYGTPGTAAWFTQTQWGAAFWQATVSLRAFRYIARPTCY